MLVGGIELQRFNLAWSRCQSSFVKKRLVVVKFAFKVDFGSKISVQQHCLTRFILLLLLVWHAPLGVRSAKRRHQSPEWTILSHSYRLIQ